MSDPTPDASLRERIAKDVAEAMMAAVERRVEGLPLRYMERARKAADYILALPELRALAPQGAEGLREALEEILALRPYVPDPKRERFAIDDIRAIPLDQYPHAVEAIARAALTATR